MSTALNPNRQLDTRGLNCPLPILRTRKALNDLASGELLEVTATDPGSVQDISVFCQQTGNELVQSSEAAGEYRYLIRKS